MPSTDNLPDKITAVVLAGGQARRMDGSDKGLLQINGKAMISYVLEAFESQVKKIVINANRNVDSYAEYGFPVISDIKQGYLGPLAGMLSCMQQVDSEYIVTAPCDSPLLAGDYVQRMLAERERSQAAICVATDGKRIQPVFCLLDCSLAGSLAAYLEGGERKIDRWFALHGMAEVDFSATPNMFRNINTPDDLRIMEKELPGEPA